MISFASVPFCVLIAFALLPLAAVDAALSSRLEAAHEVFLESRREAFPSLSDPFHAPPAARIVVEAPRSKFRQAFDWHRNVVATVFWVGELPSQNNPVPNVASAWDVNWQANFGGYDDPNRRMGYLPASFTPQLNPFYVALPYNDVIKGGMHRPEAAQAIPWFWESYKGDGISVCKGRWVAVHFSGKVCFSQWEDVGPFEVDHWQYVFGKETPRANRNQAAGIDLSPAVRDFLGLKSGDRVEWRFAEEAEVPKGPWRSWSQNRSLQK